MKSKQLNIAILVCAVTVSSATAPKADTIYYVNIVGAGFSFTRFLETQGNLYHFHFDYNTGLSSGVTDFNFVLTDGLPDSSIDPATLRTNPVIFASFAPAGGSPNITLSSFGGQSAHLGMPTAAPAAVPGPIAGAGLPGLIAACVGLLGLSRSRRRRKI